MQRVIFALGFLFFGFLPPNLIAGNNKCSRIVALARIPFEENALLAGIVANSRGGTEKTVYADWLQEHGRPFSAQILRASEQIRVLKTSSDLESQKKLAEILKTRLVDQIAVLNEWTQSPYGQNLLSLGTFGLFTPEGLPVLTPKSRDALLAASPEQIQKIFALDLGCMNLTARDFEQLLEKGPSNLIYLGLYNNHLAVEGTRALAASPHLRHLTTLDLSGNGIGMDGATALTRSRYLTELTTLLLDNNELIPEAVRVLANAQNLQFLTSLDLSWNPIGTNGARAIAQSRYLKQVTELTLSYNYIGTVGQQLIVEFLKQNRGRK